MHIHLLHMFAAARLQWCPFTHAHVYTYTHAHICKCTYTHTPTHVHGYTHTHVHMYAYTSTHAPTHVHSCQVYRPADMLVHICVYSAFGATGSRASCLRTHWRVRQPSAQNKLGPVGLGARPSLLEDPPGSSSSLRKWCLTLRATLGAYAPNVRVADATIARTSLLFVALCWHHHRIATHCMRQSASLDMSSRVVCLKT